MLSLSTAHAFGLLCAVSSVAYSAFIRITVKEGVNPGGFAIFNSLFSVAVLLLFVPVPTFAGLTTNLFLIWILANVLWTAWLFCEIRAYKDLDVAANTILYATNFLLLVLSGVLIFGEALRPRDILGIAAIVCSVLIGVGYNTLRFNRSALFRLASVVFGASAISLDKYLTAHIDINLVVLGGYLLPAIFASIASPSSIKPMIADLKKAKFPFYATAVFYAFIGLFTIYSIGLGDLGTSSAVMQSRIALSALVGICILHEREFWVRRLVGSLICTAGVWGIVS